MVDPWFYIWRLFQWGKS